MGAAVVAPLALSVSTIHAHENKHFASVLFDGLRHDGPAVPEPPSLAEFVRPEVTQDDLELVVKLTRISFRSGV